MEQSNPDCLFCKIAGHILPASIELETDDLIAFHDIHPKAPTHMLIVPKKHIPTIDHLEDQDRDLAGQLITTARDLARAKGIAETGYRLVFNVKTHGGQEVDHIHLHLIGGKQLGGIA